MTWLLFIVYIVEMIVVLGGSFEFEKTHNPEIIVRPSDNDQIPEVT